MSWMEKRIKPMLAYPSRPFDSEEHLYEIKWDGTRCIAFLGEKTRLQNRRLQDITKRYPEFQRLHEKVKGEAILDGEIVVLREGKPDFNMLQQREHAQGEFNIKLLAEEMPAQYIAFDLLYHDGVPLVGETLTTRREKLEKVVKEGEELLLSTYVAARGREFFSRAVELGLEGVIAKEKGSPYLIGERSRYWLKIKNTQTMDCVVCGYTRGEGRRSDYFGSLVLGCYLEGRLVHLGQVGSGFDEAFLRSFTEKLRRIEVPRATLESPRVKREVKWVKPLYVCEVEYLELTRDKKLRAPIFKRLKTDKDAEECLLI
jgi:bifunctional non-homologous end joining protein LigD